MEEIARQGLAALGSKLVLMVLLSAAGWWLWTNVIDLNQTIAARRMAVEQAPQDIVERARIEKQLEERRHDIRRIEQYVVERTHIVDAVTALETLAQSEGVIVRVASVAEEPVVDEKGNAVPPQGPIIDVRLTLVAYGPPADLTAFLYAIEHMPYLLSVPGWQISHEATRLPPGVVSNAPTGGPQATASPAATVVPGQLDATILLSVRYDES